MVGNVRENFLSENYQKVGSFMQYKRYLIRWYEYEEPIAFTHTRNFHTNNKAKALMLYDYLCTNYFVVSMYDDGVLL